MTTTVDDTIDAAATKLDEVVRRARAQGGAKAKLARKLEGDPAFLRKLKPSLIKARLHGENPRVEQPPPQPMTQHDGRPAPSGKRRGPSPFLVLGVAFAVGLVAARAIDWRSHAHPRA